jgi:hypothetical protein
MEYESVHQKVLFGNAVLTALMTSLIELLCIFRKQFHFVISSFKITGHRNPDNNLDSPCIMFTILHL